MSTHDLIEMLSGKRSGPLSLAVRGATGAVEPVYRWAVERRNAQFDEGRREAAVLGRPTISVGNLTTGGTGKTPMVVELCRMLRDAGRRPAVLLRGYAGKGGQESDETAELRQLLQRTAVVQADANRLRGARTLLEREEPVDVFVLDDGFQHRQAARDLDIVLIDATCPFGFDHVLPRGLLREPVESLARADVVIITRADQVDDQALGAIDQRIAELRGRPADARAVTRWRQLLSDRGDTADDTAEPLPIDALASKRVLGVCGIGNPKAFETMLRDHVGQLVDMVVFEDHYAYQQADVSRLQSQGRQKGAQAIVMTQKDYVKWRRALPNPTLRRRNWLDVIRPVLSVHWLSGEDAVRRRVAEAVALADEQS